MPIDTSTLTPQQQATAIYVAYYDRAPDPAGLQFWTDQIQAGMSLADVATAFSNAAETKAKFPFFDTPDVLSSSSFITTVYANLFGRAPDAAGLTFWTGQLDSGATPVGQIILAILEGAQDAATGGSPDSETVTNKIDVGLDWTQKAAAAGIGLSNNPIAAEVDGKLVVNDAAAFGSATSILDAVNGTPASVTTAKAATQTFIDGGTSVNTVGQTFVLTTTVGESFTGTANNDTFSATADVAGLGATPQATFNTGDMIDGAGGIDTLNLVATSAGTFAPNAGAIQNVEIINLISDTPGDDFTGANINAGNYAGVQQLQQIGGAASQDVVGVTDAITVGFNGTTVAAGAGSVQMATGATTANVQLTNVTNASIVEINETTAGTLTTANVNGSVAGAGTLTVDLDTAFGSGVSPTAETTVNLGLSGGAPAAPAGITVTSSSATTIDASMSTGHLNIGVVATATTVKGGSGNDTLIGGGASQLIEGGAGADNLTSGGVAGEVLNGGANGTVANTAGNLFDLITLGAGSQTVLTEAGHSGLTAATIDQITNFATGIDKLDFNLAAGSATNFLAGGASSGVTDALTNANTAFDGTVQYFDTQVGPNTLIFVDGDLNGTADMAIQLTGVGPIVFGDIIA